MNDDLKKQIQEQTKREFALKNLLNKWVNTADNDAAQKIGPEFEKYYKTLPRSVRVSPSNTLYRVVLVSTGAFRACQLSGKLLVLENRKYSSWTYSINAAYKFAEKRWPDKDQVLVILRRVFKSVEIFINVVAFADYVDPNWATDSDNSYFAEMIMREQEIIVKNARKTFRFKRDEIYEYKFNMRDKWHKLESI